jgi:RNA polymerase sigma-70 factor, ECF subfamily
MIVADPRNVQDTGDRAVAGLLESAAGGDESAWRRLVELYGRRVYALAKSRCRNADVAEEVAQSVFVTVASKLGRGGYSEQGKFESWLFRVAMNRIRDEMRRRNRRPPDPGAAELADEGRDGLTPELARLREAIGRLSVADREIIELRHHGAMSFRDMADLLGEPVGTLLARHHRALRKLRTMLDGTSEEGCSDER